MTVAFLDTNDASLQLWCGDNHLQSPGYALLEGGKNYQFGTGARAAARLQPRNINTRFWWQLNMEPLQPALGPARHTGDLVHAHLQAMHEEVDKPDEWVLAVPGSMQRDQLSLLLGIIGQCPFDAVGLVNRSVALASTLGGSGRIFHLEVQLHQALLSELAESNGVVELKRAVPLPGCGMLQLQERLVETIAAAFIRQTRFDPRRKAETEQALYDRLPEALQTLASQAETNLEVNGYRARVNRSDLSAAGQRLFEAAPEAMGVAKPDDRIMLDPLSHLLPGLIDKFNDPIVLEPRALHKVLTAQADHIIQRNETLSFMTALPCLAQATAPKPVEPAQSANEPADFETPIVESSASATNESAADSSEGTSPAPSQQTELHPPTHALIQDQAIPLHSAGTELATGCIVIHNGRFWHLSGANSAQAKVNGEALSDTGRLNRGDTLVLPGGASVHMIEVLS
ncbi:MAG: hypothetical protein ABJ013_15250 [Halioglobus sp.]